MTTGEIAAVLGVNDTTIKRWVRSGKLSSVATPGAHRRFRPDDLERLAVYRSRPKGLGSTPRQVHTAPNRGTNRRLLGAHQVAAMLDVDPKTVSRWSEQGHLPAAATTAGGHRRGDPTTCKGSPTSTASRQESRTRTGS